MRLHTELILWHKIHVSGFNCLNWNIWTWVKHLLVAKVSQCWDWNSSETGPGTDSEVEAGHQTGHWSAWKRNPQHTQKGRSLLAVCCVYCIHISACLLKVCVYRWNRQGGGSVANSSNKMTIIHEEDISTLAEHSVERLCQLVRNYSHLYDLTSEVYYHNLLHCHHVGVFLNNHANVAWWLHHFKWTLLFLHIKYMTSSL